MSGGAAAGAAAAAAAAAAASAIKASGTIVRVERRDFLEILERSEEPLVVRATSRFFGTSYRYLTSYKGLGFFLQSTEPLELPAKVELIEAKRIWIP